MTDQHQPGAEPADQPANGAGIDIEALLADPDTGPPERTLYLLLNGKLRSRWDTLSRELAGASPKAASLGEIAPAKAIAKEMDEVREKIRAAQVPFRLVASDPLAWKAFQDSKPTRGDGQADAEWEPIWHRWVCEMVALACADPVMTGEQVERLAKKLSPAQWLDLSNTAWDLNSEREKVPSSAAVFVLTRDGGDSSRQHETQESPSHDS